MLFLEAELDVPDASQLPAIACPECGVPTVARDDGFLCLECVRATYDWRGPLEAHVAKHPKLLAVRRCNECARVLTSDPAAKVERWEACDRESDALLAFLLRRIKSALIGKKAAQLVAGLSNGLRGRELVLADARLVWTEPHSRRLRLDAELSHASVRQRCEFEFVEEGCKCDDCAGEAREKRNRKMGKGGGDFGCRVQIRVARLRTGDAAAGARTLRSLEEFLRSLGKRGGPRELRFAAHRLPHGRGLDVDFDEEREALTFVEELRRAGRAPVRLANRTKKLVTHDPKANTAEFQRTILLEIPPVSKHDLVKLGRRVFLATSVRATIALADVVTGELRDYNAEAYFKNPFDAVASTKSMIEVRVVGKAPLSEDVDVARHADDDPVPADARRLPEASRRAGAVVKAYDLHAVVGVDLSKLPRFVLVAPGGAKEDGDDATTAVSTVMSKAAKRKAKKRAAQSASVASDAPTERDFDDDEFQSLLDQPATIPELGELEIDDDDDGAPPLGSDESWVKVS